MLRQKHGGADGVSRWTSAAAAASQRGLRPPVRFTSKIVSGPKPVSSQQQFGTPRYPSLRRRRRSPPSDGAQFLSAVASTDVPSSKSGNLKITDTNPVFACSLLISEAPGFSHLLQPNFDSMQISEGQFYKAMTEKHERSKVTSLQNLMRFSSLSNWCRCFFADKR